MRFTIEDKHVIKWLWVSKNDVAHDAFWQKMKFWWAKDTFRCLTLLILQLGGRAVCGQP